MYENIARRLIRYGLYDAFELLDDLRDEGIRIADLFEKGPPLLKHHLGLSTSAARQLLTLYVQTVNDEPAYLRVDRMCDAAWGVEAIERRPEMRADFVLIQGGRRDNGYDEIAEDVFQCRRA